MKIVKYAIIGLVVVAAIGAMMASTFIWHQPETPECIA